MAISSLFGDIFSTTPIKKLSKYEFGTHSDLNYLVWGYIRIHLQQMKSKIPSDITLLCSEYAGAFVNSDILFGNLNVYLIELLEKRNIQCELSRKIYTAKRDGFDSKSFYEKFKKHYDNTHDQNNNKKTKIGSVLIIQSTRGSIFGGYTKTKWKLNSSCYDQTAFLFHLYQPNDGAEDIENENKNLFSFQALEEAQKQITANIFNLAPTAASEMFAVCRPKNYYSNHLFFWGSPESLYMEQNCNKSEKNFVQNGGYSMPKVGSRIHFTVHNFEIFELG
eukprot:223434_1